MTEFHKKMKRTYSVAHGLLTAFGFRPDDKSKFAKLRACVFMAFLIFLNLTVLNAVFYEWPVLPMVALRLNMLAGAMHTLMLLVMYLIHRDKIAELLRIMQEEFWNEADEGENDEKELIQYYGRLGFKVNLLQTVVLMAVCPTSAMRQIIWLIAVIFNSDPEKSIPRILWVENWYTSYIDIYADPYFQILFVSQIAGVFTACAGSPTIQAMFFYLVMSVSAQFRLLQERIRKYDKNRSEEESQIYLYKCLKYHQKLSDICHELNVCFTWSLFYLFMLFSLYLCLNAYIFILFETNKTLVLYKLVGITGTVLELFTACYCSDYLTNQSVAVADAAYDCNWVDAPQNIKQIICIIIMRAQKPIYISVSGFAPTTLATFQALMRFSYSVFAMLNSTLNN